MENWLDSLVDQVSGSVKERIINDVVTMFAIEKGLPLELNKKQCAMMFGVDPKTFDARFNRHQDFPRIPNAREKYPRDEVVEWYRQNWRRTGALK